MRDDRSKFIRICEVMGWEITSKIPDMISVNINGREIGTMTASAWLDHLRNSMINGKRS